MGKMKVIRESELGSTTSNDKVYPITTSEAVHVPNVGKLTPHVHPRKVVSKEEFEALLVANSLQDSTDYFVYGEQETSNSSGSSSLNLTKFGYYVHDENAQIYQNFISLCEAIINATKINNTLALETGFHLFPYQYKNNEANPIIISKPIYVTIEEGNNILGGSYLLSVTANNIKRSVLVSGLQITSEYPATEIVKGRYLSQEVEDGIFPPCTFFLESRFLVPGVYNVILVPSGSAILGVSEDYSNISDTLGVYRNHLSCTLYTTRNRSELHQVLFVSGVIESTKTYSAYDDGGNIKPFRIYKRSINNYLWETLEDYTNTDTILDGSFIDQTKETEIRQKFAWTEVDTSVIEDEVTVNNITTRRYVKGNNSEGTQEIGIQRTHVSDAAYINKSRTGGVSLIFNSEDPKDPYADLVITTMGNHESVAHKKMTLNRTKLSLINKYITEELHDDNNYTVYLRFSDDVTKEQFIAQMMPLIQSTQLNYTWTNNDISDLWDKVHTNDEGEKELDLGIDLDLGVEGYLTLLDATTLYYGVVAACLSGGFSWVFPITLVLEHSILDNNTPKTIVIATFQTPNTVTADDVRDIIAQDEELNSIRTMESDLYSYVDSSISGLGGYTPDDYASAIQDIQSSYDDTIGSLEARIQGADDDIAQIGSDINDIRSELEDVRIIAQDNGVTPAMLSEFMTVTYSLSENTITSLENTITNIRQGIMKRFNPNSFQFVLRVSGENHYLVSGFTDEYITQLIDSSQSVMINSVLQRTEEGKLEFVDLTQLGLQLGWEGPILAKYIIGIEGFADTIRSEAGTEYQCSIKYEGFSALTGKVSTTMKTMHLWDDYYLVTLKLFPLNQYMLFIINFNNYTDEEGLGRIYEVTELFATSEEQIGPKLNYYFTNINSTHDL